MTALGAAITSILTLEEAMNPDWRDLYYELG